MKPVILAIDQGTTSTRAMLFGGDGKKLASHAVSLRQIYPANGWVEHDATEIWHAALACCRAVLKQTKPGQVMAIGVTNQRETSVIWDRATGKPLYNAIVWQDRRTAQRCAALKAQGIADRDMQTGNFFVSPQYANPAPNEPNQQRLTGYQVSNQLQIRLNDVAALGPTLDRLVAAGANQINSVNFAIRDSAALLNEARAKAVADARAKAETYAKAAGVTLGPILSISEDGGNAPRPMMAMTMRAEKFTPIMVGEESISANVSIIWIIQ